MISYAPLRSILRERNISFRQLRREVGIHATATTYLNNDTGYVSLYALEKLCRYLDVPLHEIVIYVPDEP